MLLHVAFKPVRICSHLCVWLLLTTDGAQRVVSKTTTSNFKMLAVGKHHEESQNPDTWKSPNKIHEAFIYLDCARNGVRNNNSRENLMAENKCALRSRLPSLNYDICKKYFDFWRWKTRKPIPNSVGVGWAKREINENFITANQSSNNTRVIGHRRQESPNCVHLGYHRLLYAGNSNSLYIYCS